MTAILALGGYNTGEVVEIGDRTISKVSDPATATLTIDNDGNVYNHNLTNLEAWITPATAVTSNYEVRATLTAGTTPTSGTMATWINCGTDREWSNIADAGTPSKVSTLLIEIRDTATSTVRDSASIAINASTTA